MSFRNPISVRTALRKVGSAVVDHESVIRRTDRAARSRLTRIGAYWRRVARNSLKSKRDLPVSQFPRDLLQLLGDEATGLDRDEQGRIKKGARARRDAALKEMIQPWPQTTGTPGRAPRVTAIRTKGGKLFKPFRNLITFKVEQPRRSVIMGPEVEGSVDVPGDVEFGGTRVRRNMQWKAFTVRGRRVIRFVQQGKKSKRMESFPYTGPAFDKTLDALVPRIFREIVT